jgi:5-bromo-4-chloroindolyl phosphate hydrolysis protein
LPWWWAAGASVAVFVGVWLAGKPSSGGGLSDDAVLEARGDTSRRLVTDAVDAIARLRKAAGSIRDPDMREQVAALLQTGERVVKDVRENPDRAMAVRRLLTFYLPNAASVAEGWRTLETRTSASATERMTQARDVMKSLTAAFDQYADAVAEPELQSLDLDLKILKDALKADQKSLT